MAVEQQAREAGCGGYIAPVRHLDKLIRVTRWRGGSGILGHVPCATTHNKKDDFVGSIAIKVVPSDGLALKFRTPCAT